jgi:DNA-binding NarL/FixJ family response regulator
MPLRILLVDDHRMMLAGIRAILEQSPDFTVIGEAQSGSEAVAECREKHPDVIVMDIGLPGMNGIEATKIILRDAPATKVIMLSIYDDEISVVSAIRSGARGYLPKKASGSDLLKAIRTVANEGSYLSPHVSYHLFQRIKMAGRQSSPTTSALDVLAPRELQVFWLVAAGNANKEIAVILDLGLATVRTCRMNMMRKLKVSDIVGVIQLAVATGMAFPSALAGARKRVPIVVNESEEPEVESGSNIHGQVVNTSRS